MGRNRLEGVGETPLASCLSAKQQALQTLPRKETTDVTSQTAKLNLLLELSPSHVSVLALSHACYHLRAKKNTMHSKH